MRCLALRLIVALLAFIIGVLAAAIGNLLSWGLVVSPGSSLPALLTVFLGAFWCFVFAFVPSKGESNFLFTLLMVGCGLVILLAGLGMIAGALLD
jgi:hypothetical protein